MCGIAGFFTPHNSTTPEQLHSQAKAMSDTIPHRGPDGEGTWVNAQDGIALAHRRLAIVDLSPAGHQPMTASDERFTITYNGEIYNADDLRPQLIALGFHFKGHSDTEVIANGFSAWGVEATIRKLIGMFAIAAWDSREKTLYLVRDRMGIKPLYWHHREGTTLFGSELKCLQAHPQAPNRLDERSIASFLRFSAIPAPHTIYEDIHKLEPGHILSISAHGDIQNKAYWSLDTYAFGPRDTARSYEESVDALESLLSDAVKRRMVADVPLGAFLSGGIDSSTVAALMQKHSSAPIKTFSIGFDDPNFNEAAHAKAVAQHLGTEHTELYMSAQDALDVIPTLSTLFDEPFADSSQIPTYLVSKMTRDHVTVALSGDGGDELFGGYRRYFTAHSLSKRALALPALLRKIAQCGISSLSPRQWDTLSHVIPKSKRPNMLGDKLYKFAQAIQGNEQDFYQSLVSQWQNPAEALIHGREHTSLIHDANTRQALPDFVEWMQYLDSKTYMVDDILTKVDRASMGCSLEARVPLLDHRVVEFAWTLPMTAKIQNGQGKKILRDVLYRHVPRSLIDRPKSGFALPLGDWLRGPLLDWAESLLSEMALNSAGLYDTKTIRQSWQNHLKGQENNQHKLWSILMLQGWLQNH